LRELADALEADAPAAGKAPPAKRRARRAPPVTPVPAPNLDDATRAIANAALKRAGMFVPKS
jgi:hypothetical protein